MKKILSYLLLSVALVSCSLNLDPLYPETQGGITVQVYGGADTKMSSTLVGDLPGEEELNENLITSLDIFFFPPQDVHQSDAEYQDVRANYHLFVADLNRQVTYTVARDLDKAKLRTIFGVSSDAELVSGLLSEVYVIANLDSDASRFTGDQTHRTLRSAVLDREDFGKVTEKTVEVGGENRILKTGNKVKSFVMEGWDAATLVNESGVFFLQADVALYRAASKVKLEVTIPQAVKDNGVEDTNGFVWVPLDDRMEVIMMKGVNRGVVCAADTKYQPYAIESGDYFPAPPDGTDSEKRTWIWKNYGHSMIQTGTKTESGTDIGPMYEHETPFYSYPTFNWKNDIDNEAYMVLMLPWQRKGKAEFHDTYYQIPIVQDWAFDEQRLKSNRYYRMEVKVSILGSFAAEQPVTIVPNQFIVLSWRDNAQSDPTQSEVDMAHTSYLAVETNNVVMNNVAKSSVEYASSHDVTVSVKEIEFMDYSQKQIRKGKITPDQKNRIYWYTQNTEGEWVATGDYTTSNGIYASYVADITTKEGSVTLTHTIPSDMYTVQTITVNVDNGVVSPETIEFKQYPPISIEAHESNGYVFVNRIGNETDTDNVYTYNNADWIGSINARSSAAGVIMTGTNTNPNIYSIHISSFSDDEFIIGDPRVSVPDNNMGHSDSSWSQATQYNYSTTDNGGTHGTYYFNYSEYSSNTFGITINRTEETTTRNVTGGPGRNNWDSYTSEANAYAGADNWYYWRTYNYWEGYTYHRARYSFTGYRSATTSEGLSNYYPTNPTGTAYMIAPEFLIASSYGKTSYTNMTLDRARLRCALYQEDGYPAGRWRLPTFAEVKFIMSLSTAEKIPTLFQMSKGDYVGYWCANGKVVEDNQGNILLETPGNYTNTSNTAPRCVYDLWYWGDKDETDPYATTWHLGDND